MKLWLNDCLIDVFNISFSVISRQLVCLSMLSRRFLNEYITHCFHATGSFPNFFFSYIAAARVPIHALTEILKRVYYTFSFRATGCFPNITIVEMIVRREWRINHVAMTIINLQKEICQAIHVDLNQRLLVSKPPPPHISYSAAGPYVYINPFPSKLLFLRVFSRSRLKKLWKNEKLIVASNFSFSHSVMCHF